MPRRLAALSLFALLPLLVTGCSAGFTSEALSSTAPVTGAAISGRANGGRQPIDGARIYLLQANTANYAGPGIAADSSGTASDNSSRSLLTSGDSSDSIGYYVLTDSSGYFTLPSGYTCDSGGQVYLLSLGGNTGSGSDNSAAGLMAVLGPCGSFGPSTIVNMNEASTVAAAYAIAGFATDPTHVGAPSATDTLAATGIQNAFANADQLFDVNSFPVATASPARATTPNGNGQVPQQQIDTLANMLAACVNTSGPASNQCSTLFGAIQSAGASGTQATDTATEAIYIAHNPGINVATAYGVTGIAAVDPYIPWFSTTAPTDFSVGIKFTGGGLVTSGALAIDASGNAWVGDDGGATALSPLGTFLTGPDGYTTGLGYAPAVSIDSHGNVWIASNTGVSHFNVTNGSITADQTITNSNLAFYSGVAVDSSDGAWILGMTSNFRGALLHATSDGTISGPYDMSIANLIDVYGIAIDNNGHLWVGSGDQGVFEFDNAGNPLNDVTDGSFQSPLYPAVDALGDIWVANDEGTTLSEISSSGTFLDTYSGGGIFGVPEDVDFDGSNHIWSINRGDNYIAVMDTSGNALGQYIAPLTDATTSQFYQSLRSAVDPSGNIWVTDSTDIGNSWVTELIGIATPVYTPISVATTNHKLAQRP